MSNLSYITNYLNSTQVKTCRSGKKTPKNKSLSVVLAKTNMDTN